MTIYKLWRRQGKSPAPHAPINRFGKKNSFHCKIEIEKPTHWFNFWTSLILSVWPHDSHYSFSIFTAHSSSENIRSCCYSRESRYATEIYFLLFRYQLFVFHRNWPMVDPWIKWRKSKDRPKKPSKIRPYQDLSKRVHVSGFVSHRISTLPFLLKVPALLAIKLVCLWFLWLAKHIVKWWVMPSYLTQERVLGGTPWYGIYRYVQPQRVRFSAVLAINSV